MKDKVGLKSNWEICVPSLKHLLNVNAGVIRYGLGLFPDVTGEKCAQDNATFPVAANNEAAISSLLTASLQIGNANYPDGPCVTNIDTAVQQAASEPTLVDR